MLSEAWWLAMNLKSWENFTNNLSWIVRRCCKVSSWNCNRLRCYAFLKYYGKLVYLTSAPSTPRFSHRFSSNSTRLAPRYSRNAFLGGLPAAAHLSWRYSIKWATLVTWSRPHEIKQHNKPYANKINAVVYAQLHYLAPIQSSTIREFSTEDTAGDDYEGETRR